MKDRWLLNSPHHVLGLLVRAVPVCGEVVIATKNSYPAVLRLTS